VRLYRQAKLSIRHNQGVESAPESDVFIKNNRDEYLLQMFPAAPGENESSFIHQRRTRCDNRLALFNNLLISQPFFRLVEIINNLAANGTLFLSRMYGNEKVTCQLIIDAAK
jgi:hypothetical protein